MTSGEWRKFATGPRDLLIVATTVAEPIDYAVSTADILRQVPENCELAWLAP
jgi:hypothetical protein